MLAASRTTNGAVMEGVMGDGGMEGVGVGSGMLLLLRCSMGGGGL